MSFESSQGHVRVDGLRWSFGHNKEMLSIGDNRRQIAGNRFEPGSTRGGRGNASRSVKGTFGAWWSVRPAV